MRVLQVHNVQTAYGGVDEVIRLERSALRRRGCEVSFLGVETEAVVETHGRYGAAARAVHNRDAIRQLRRAIDETAPDVVHVHTPFPVMSLAPLRAAHDRGAAVVATSHSFRYSCIAATLTRNGHDCHDCVGRRIKVPGVRRRCYHGSLAGSLALTAGLALHRTVWNYPSWVDRFLVMTPFAAEVLSTEGIDRGAIVVKPNFSDDLGYVDSPDRAAVALPVSERPVRFVYAGRLESEKGVATLLDAWHGRGGRGDGHDRCLAIAGDGALRLDVERAASLNPTIEYLGFLDREDLRRCLSGADVVVFPSEWPEAGPTLAMMEAFSVGAPILAADQPNFSFVIDEDANGWTYPSGSAEGLRHRLDSVTSLGRDALHDLRGKARATYDQHFSEDVVIPQLLACYRQAMAARLRVAT